MTWPHAVGLFRIVIRLTGFVALMEIRKKMVHFIPPILITDPQMLKFRNTGKNGEGRKKNEIRGCFTAHAGRNDWN